MSGTAQRYEPEFATFVATAFQTPPVEYSIVTPAEAFTQESGSVIFEGVHSSVRVADPLQNKAAEGVTHTSEAIVGAAESFTTVTLWQDSLFDLYALSIQSTVTSYEVPSASPTGTEKPV